MMATITPETTMRELLEIFPGAQRALFRQYHIGGCSSCGFQPAETVAEVCARNENLPVNGVIDYLAASQEQDDRMQISPPELAEKMRAGTPVRLVDVRTREEFEITKIDGAILMTQDLLTEAMANWPRHEMVVLICHHGIRSLDAAAYFSGHGFTDVKSLRGGLDAWSLEIDPSVRRYHLE